METEEPKTSLSKTLCREAVCGLSKLCKNSKVLSDNTIDSLATDVLNNDRLITSTAETLDTIALQAPRITFVIAGAVALGFVVQKVYSMLKTPENHEDEGNQ